MQTPAPTPNPDLKAQYALAPLVESAAELVTDDDLIRIAENLARQFKYNAWSAELGEVRWYQERVAEKVCTEARATLLRNMTVYACVRETRPLLATMPDNLRDFGRADVKDTPQNRARRANFFGTLPRVLAPEDIAKDDIPPSMAEDPLIETEDLRGLRGVTGVALLVGCCLVAVAVTLIQKAVSWVVRP